MKVQVVLALLLFILMAAVGGKKGIKSFMALFMNGAIIAVSVVLISWHVSMLLIMILNFLSILLVNLFFINQQNVKTVCAFLATLLTLTVMSGFIYFLVKYAMIQGFGEEEQDAISGLTLKVGLNFTQVSMYVIVVSSIGAIVDVAMSISSALYETFRLRPEAGVTDLVRSGLKIGRDILATTTNTLYFALIGGYLTLMIWFKTLSYSIGEVINAKVFAAELVSILSGATGVVLVIPVTAMLSAYILVRHQNKRAG